MKGWQTALWLSGLVLPPLIIQLGLTIASWRRPDRSPLLTGTVHRLPPCLASHNCVCSHDSGPSHVFPLETGHNPTATMARLKAVCQQQLGFRLVDESETYLRFECISTWMRYVDDLEFLYDPHQGVIHVRSASRVGTSDFGANRARVERLRRILQNDRPGPPALNSDTRAPSAPSRES